MKQSQIKTARTIQRLECKGCRWAMCDIMETADGERFVSMGGTVYKSVSTWCPACSRIFTAYPQKPNKKKQELANVTV